MLKITSSPTLEKRASADVLVLPVWMGKKSAELDCKDASFKEASAFPFKNGDFKGKEGEILLLYSPKIAEGRILLVGLGERDGEDPEKLRAGYAFAIKTLRSKKFKKANIALPLEAEKLPSDVVCRAIVEGCVLANYSFPGLRGKPQEACTALSEICFCGVDKSQSELFKRTLTLMESVNFVRDLVNGNADEVNPVELALRAKELEKSFEKVKTTIIDKKRLEKEKVGLLLAVGRASFRDPALIIIEYMGDPKSKQKCAIVGKGVTFDTGGLNLKGSGMETMKCDMAGAGAALGVVRAAAELKLKKNIVCALAATENAIGPMSYKPGDVYRSYLGKTVEITDTDAEGRLVLADAVAYVEANYAPSCIIDLATLTGGIVVAIGEEAAGLFSNSESLASALQCSAGRTHERVWRMPLFPEFKERLKSPIADLKNSAGRKGSPCLGATFIKQFVGDDLPWAHLDIAGTAYLSELHSYHPTYATGYGVRLLIDFLENLDEL